MKVNEVKVANIAGLVSIAQGSDVVVMTVDQAYEAVEMIRAAIDEIRPRYPWFVRAGYGSEDLAIADGLSKPKSK